MLGAAHGVIGSVTSLVTLGVVELRWQAEAFSLISVSTGVVMLLVGPLAGVQFLLFKA